MKNISILFIGNSFTYFNDMPNSIFKKLCISANINVNVDSITEGGYKLLQFTDENNEFGEKVLQTFRTKSYDIVILQEQSRNPIVDFDNFLEGAKKLHSLAIQNGAQVYLYQTWGYKEGHEYLLACASSTDDMTYKLKDAYEAVRKVLKCECAPVGMAFLDVNKNSKINLYNKDLFHPSLCGSTLAALVLFGTIFKTSPLDVIYNGDITFEETGILKKAAYNAIKDKI